MARPYPPPPTPSLMARPLEIKLFWGGGSLSILSGGTQRGARLPCHPPPGTQFFAFLPYNERNIFDKFMSVAPWKNPVSTADPVDRL